MKYFVYILKCNDNTLYTGITTNIPRRVSEHNGEGKLGAKYTKMRRPVKLIYESKHKDRSEASKEEIRIKKMSKKQKEELVSTFTTSK